MPLPRNKNLSNNAKNLRKYMTPQERHLWYDFLRAYPIKIYKQKVIGDYITEFYCNNAKLVIELDGSQHYEIGGLKYDKQRTEYFKSIGIEVIRFTNRDCDSHFDEVCTYIDSIIQKRRIE